VQEAQAMSAHVYDRISWNNWVFTPGLRYEDIDQKRTRWEIRDGRSANPASRDAANLRDTRQNRSGVLIPGVGALFSFDDRLALYGGVHKGFTAPSNAPDVDEEQSVNYELGVRVFGQRLQLDAAAFFTDYDNLLGECTSSSGSDCEAGDAFNGDAATIAGLELLVHYDLSPSVSYALPLTFSYTWLDGEFDSNIADTDFFGDVAKGDPLPYIPDNQFLLSLGLERDRWAAYLSANYVDESCVRASCGEFEKTDATFILDFAANFRLNDHLTFYTKVDNLTAEKGIVARQPYGARPTKDRTIGLGAKFSL
jgi:Fe(3+) dicitrate transport protein